MRSLAFAIAPLVATAPAFAQTGVSLDADLKPVITGLETAWNTADGKAWARQFWDDADSVNIYGGTLHGGPAMGARHAVVWAGRAKGSMLHIDVRSARRLDGEVAVVDMVQLVDHPGASGPDAPRPITVYVTCVLQRRVGEWRIVHVQNTRLSTPPAEKGA